MKYYKAMNKDFTCRGFQYEIGGIYELPKDVKLELCQNGFHFCDILANCFNYYDIDSCIICEVEPLGRIIHDEYTNKLVTDKIKIVRQLSDEEIEKEQYVIQDGIEMIGDSCFNYCTGLKEVTIPDSVTYIGCGAFWCCNNLKEINIPDGVTYIGKDAFYDCESLEKITISNNIRYIGLDVFYNCTSLKNITIPNVFNYIDEFAFYGCKNLEKIYVPKDFDIKIFDTYMLDDNIKLLDQVEIVRIEK